MSTIDRTVCLLGNINAKHVLEESLKNTLSTVRQRMIGQVNDNTQDCVTNFIARLEAQLTAFCGVWIDKQFLEKSTPIIPDNVKYFIRTEGCIFVIVEQKPSVRSLLFPESLLNGIPDRRYSSDDPRRTDGIPRRVSLPYVIFTIAIKGDSDAGLWVHYRTEPLKSLGDILYSSNLPNIMDPGCSMCLGTTSIHVRGLPLSDQIDNVLKAFYSSTFNNDYTACYAKIANSEPKMKTLQHWVNNSAEDPSFILKVKFSPYCTVTEWLTRIGASADATASALRLKMAICIQTGLSEIAAKLTSWLHDSANIIADSTTERVLTEEINNIVAKALDACEKRMSNFDDEYASWSREDVW